MTSVHRILLAALIIARGAAAQAPDPRVETLLRRMTLEEKVGEMTQLDITAVTDAIGGAKAEDHNRQLNPSYSGVRLSRNLRALYDRHLQLI